MRGRQFHNWGLTLVEVMIASVISLALLVAVSFVIRRFGEGVRFMETVLPRHRQALTAAEIVTKDFSSGLKGSLANIIPNPGFEEIGFIPLSSPWHDVPTRIDPINPSSVGNAQITTDNRNGLVRSGRASLGVSSFGGSFSVRAPTCQLTDGQTYVLSAWVRKRPTPVANGREGGITLFGDPNATPSTVVKKLRTASTTWTYLEDTFTAVAGLNYQVSCDLDSDPSAPDVPASFYFDDVLLAPREIILSPEALQSFEFLRYDTANGRLNRIRYSVVAFGTGGKLLRELIPPVGAAVRLSSVPEGVLRFKIQSLRDRVLISMEIGSEASGKTTNISFASSMGAP